MVPESLPKDKRRAFDWGRANPFGTLLRLRRTSGLGVLTVVYFLASLSTFVYPAAWSYVAIAKFGWTEAQIGWSIAYYGAVFVLSQAVVIPILMPRLGERRVIWITFVVEAIGLVGIATAPNGFWLYGWISLALISGMQGPALQKVMTERVGADAQGELQGGLSALGSLVLIISPLLYTQLLFAFERGVAGIVFPGAPFVVAAGFSVLGLILFILREPRSGAQAGP